jgi:hypothetical protein
VDPTKDSSFGPGTRGIMSYVRGYDSEKNNVCYARFVALRRGKSGKMRMDFNELKFPIFVSTESDLSETFIDKEKKFFVFIESRPLICNNVIDLESHEFIGWSLAKVNFLAKVHRWVNHNIWPKTKNNIINQIQRMPEVFEADPDQHLKRFEDVELRENLVDKIRQLECKMSRLILQHIIRVKEMEIKAIKTIISSKTGLKKELLEKAFSDRTLENKKMKEILKAREAKK